MCSPKNLFRLIESNKILFQERVMCCIVIMSCLVLCVISVHPGAELLSVESQVMVVRRQRVGELSSVGYQDKSNA